MFAGEFSNALFVPLFVFFLFFLLRALLKRQWLAVGVFLLLAILQGLGGIFTAGQPWLEAAVLLVFWGTAVLLLTRFGLLCAVAYWYGGGNTAFVLTSNLSAWYAGYGLIPIVLTLGVAIWAFRNALGGRPLLREGWLDG